jgi:hypothetical protein
MIRKLLYGFALAVGAGLTVGCEAAKDAGKDAKKTTADAAKGAAEAAKGAAEAAQDAAKSSAEAAAKAAEAAKESAKAAADKAGETAKAAMDKAKTDLIKPMEEYYPKIEEKIKGLTGDANTKAAAAFTALKRHVEEFKAAPADKYKELMGALTSKFEQLKKMVGL